MNSISPNLNIMIKAAEKASKILIRDFGELENLQVSKKGPRDFVTNSDKKVEKIIIEELLKSKKRFSVLSEETGEIKNHDLENTWLIDPIDGTLNFLHGLPHFAISIALLCIDALHLFALLCTDLLCFVLLRGPLLLDAKEPRPE